MTIQEKEQKIAAVMRDKSTPLPLRARAIERIHEEFKAASISLPVKRRHYRPLESWLAEWYAVRAVRHVAEMLTRTAENDWWMAEYYRRQAAINGRRAVIWAWLAKERQTI